MDSLQTISNDLVESINEKEKKKAIPYDTYAKVIRIDSGTAWVHIPGGVDETPVALTVNAKVGDSVLVRVSGGNAWIVGNSSAPPTDDTKAVEAKGVADGAQETAESAQETAEGAEEIAKDASRAVKATSQYFWHTETDTGAGAGAHITEVPQEDFLDDPANGGGNLLAQSGGIYVRDGLQEVATFGAGGAQIGQTGKAHLTMSSRELVLNDKEGHAFFTAKDLRGENGIFERTDTFRGNGTSTQFILSMYAVDTDYTVTVADSSGGTIQKGDNWINFSTAPTAGVTITATYETESTQAKTYVLGVTSAGNNPGPCSVVEGYSCLAEGAQSHAEGKSTYVRGACAHAEGILSIAHGTAAHAEGYETSALGEYSHAQNKDTYAAYDYQTVIGSYNSNRSDTLLEIGNGDYTQRSNALAVDWSGNVDIAGKLQSFFSIVNLEVAVGQVAAHTQNNIGTVTVPTADQPDGMTLVGIVGVACNNYRVVPYNYYVNGAHSITCAVVNTTTAQSAAGTTMTFKLLYAKMASA